VVATVRVGQMMDAIPAALRETLIIFAMLLPCGCLVAIPIGVAIAKSALKPIHQITKAASDIAQGDLSRRVEAPDTRDEVGNLAVTFNRMIDAMERAMARERQFTSDASHELRTPLSVILANGESGLQPDATPEEALLALRAIQETGGRMRAMISQLLLLARGAEQQKAMELQRLDLAEVCEDVVETIRPRAKEKNMAVSSAADGAIFVTADLMLITNAALNLADNAVKYGKAGGHIVMDAKREADFARLSVTDDGDGIPSEHLPRVFDRFYRADPSRVGEGTGLGLSIVKRIAELHGGSVEITSQPGKTCVSILFPLAE
jgi:heavy metal sensor kinase